MNILLHELSWTAAKEYFAENDIVILPVGSNEQHGTANPLGTDHLVAKAIAEEVAKQTGVLCLPTVPFGVSSHHRQFWGTVYVSPEVFKEYLKEVCLSVGHSGATKIVIVNGHGGNLSSLMAMARELRQHGVFVSVFQWWLAARILLPGIFRPEERGHAGSEETSVNLALHSQLVGADSLVNENPSKHIAQVEGLSLPLDTVDETKSGVFGEQKGASAQKGIKVLEAVVSELVRHVNLLKKCRIEDLAERSMI